MAAWPCVTLTPGQLHMAPRYLLTPVMLHAVQKHTPESNETHPDTIDRKIRRFRPGMTYDVVTSWPDISGGQNFQDMSNWSKRGYSNFGCDTTLYTRVIYKNHGGFIRPPLQVRGLIKDNNQTHRAHVHTCHLYHSHRSGDKATRHLSLRKEGLLIDVLQPRLLAWFWAGISVKCMSIVWFFLRSCT